MLIVLKDNHDYITKVYLISKSFLLSEELLNWYHITLITNFNLNAT